MTVAIICFTISLFIGNTQLAIMAKEIGLVRSTITKALILIPPCAVIVGVVFAFKNLRKTLANYFKP